MSHSIPHLAGPFSVPPPPLPINPSFIQPLLAREGQRLVDDFIKRKMIHSQVKNQQLVGDYQKKVDELKQLNNLLIASSGTLSDEEWQEKVRVIEMLSEEVDGILTQLSTKQQKNKRRKRKKKKSNCKSSTKGKLAQRMELHMKIDKWREERHKEIINEHEIEQNKKGLRKCLNDNLKRTQEAMEIMSKLQSAIDLKVKENSDSEVIDKLNQLIAVWKDALMEYRTERMELESYLGIKPEKNEEVYDAWFETLFVGSAGENSWNSNITAEELIAVRSQWDSCISTEDDATSVPFFWVLPPLSTPSTIERDASWTKYRV